MTPLSLTPWTASLLALRDPVAERLPYPSMGRAAAGFHPADSLSEFYPQEDFTSCVSTLIQAAGNRVLISWLEYSWTVPDWLKSLIVPLQKNQDQPSPSVSQLPWLQGSWSAVRGLFSNTSRNSSLLIWTICSSTYKRDRSTEDAVSLGLYSILTHLENIL